MKRIFKTYIIETASLYIISQFVDGLVFSKGIQSILFAGAALTVASIVIKPVINLLLLPINLITFGLFKWVSSAIALYLVTILISDFRITAFSFLGYSSKWIDIPAINLPGILAIIAFSFIISLVTSILGWLIK